MIEFISLRFYELVFDVVVLVSVIAAAAMCRAGTTARRGARITGTAIAVALTLYIGLRPVSPYYFGDTINYAYDFWRLQSHGGGVVRNAQSDPLFGRSMEWVAGWGDVHLFFLFCAVVYVGGLWWALVRIFGREWFVPLVVSVSMFTFWSYGVNGVRNGMAASVMILALSHYRKWVAAAVFAAIAIGFHKSVALMALAAVGALAIRRPKFWLAVWMGGIVVSLVAGGAISGWLTASGMMGDERLAHYLTAPAAGGFRWDFLLYSAAVVAAGAFFLFRKRYVDPFYWWIFNTYLISNAFWIVVIRASFSNRFAQISWFLAPLVLIYPFLKGRFWDDQNVKTGFAVVAAYLYTFYTVFLQ